MIEYARKYRITGGGEQAVMLYWIEKQFSPEADGWILRYADNYPMIFFDRSRLIMQPGGGIRHIDTGIAIEVRIDRAYPVAPKVSLAGQILLEKMYVRMQTLGPIMMDLDVDHGPVEVSL